MLHTQIARNAALSAMLTVGLAAVSCTPQQQQGAGLGALGGAALGAIAGDDSSDVIRGAAIGAAVGTGAAAYQENRNKRVGNFNNGGDIYKAPQAPAAPKPPAVTAPPKPEYPLAKVTTNPNLVQSPYPPHNIIDISKLGPNETLARDTSAGKIFRIPGR